MSDVRDNPEHLRVLEDWLRSATGRTSCSTTQAPAARACGAPAGGRAADEREPASPTAATAPARLRLPDFREYAATSRAAVPRPRRRRACSAQFLRDVIRLNRATFRLFGPDETASNRLGAVFEVTDKAWSAEILPVDEHLAPDGRVIEILSEHTCQGWLEGYLLTGRHGLFNCYEAFIHIVDSMFNQHAKWLKTTREIPWRRPIASLNYLLSAMSGARTTTASATRIPASSITS